MRTETRKFDVGRRTIDVELYFPPERGPRQAPWSGVLLLHELFGLDSDVRADARALARAGFLTMAPNLYGGGMGRYCMRMFFSPAALTNTSGSAQVAEVHDCLDVLKAMPECNGKLGMIGMCLTGGFALHMARRDDMDAPVVFHHSFGLRGAGLPASDAAEIRGPVLGHFAAEDRFLCPKSRVRALEHQLGDKLRSHTYPGVGHGLRSQFRYTPQGEEAWQRTLGFFEEQL